MFANLTISELGSLVGELGDAVAAQAKEHGAKHAEMAIELIVLLREALSVLNIRLSVFAF